MLLWFCQRSRRCLVSVIGQLALTDGPADKCHVGNVTKQQCLHGHPAGTPRSWHEPRVFVRVRVCYCCCWNEWMNECPPLRALFRFSTMRMILIYVLLKPWNRLLLKHRGLYLHPVSSAKRTLSSSWSCWRTRPLCLCGWRQKISFSSSFNG